MFLNKHFKIKIPQSSFRVAKLVLSLTCRRLGSRSPKVEQGMQAPRDSAWNRGVGAKSPWRSCSGVPLGGLKTMSKYKALVPNFCWPNTNGHPRQLLFRRPAEWVCKDLNRCVGHRSPQRGTRPKLGTLSPMVRTPLNHWVIAARVGGSRLGL